MVILSPISLLLASIKSVGVLLVIAVAASRFGVVISKGGTIEGVFRTVLLGEPAQKSRR